MVSIRVSTKPTTIPNWDTGNVVSVAPTAGHIASGWAVNEVPTHSEMSGWQQLVGKWLQWLNDGDIALHNVDITGTLTQEQAATFQSSVDMEGGLNTFGSMALKGEQAIALATGFTNNLTIPGTTSSLVVNLTWLTSTSPTTPRGITGIVAPTDGRVWFIRNLEQASPAGGFASHRVVLYHEHTGSTAANRIHLPNNALGLMVVDAGGSGTPLPGLVIPPDGVVALRYDSTTQRHNVVGASFAIRGCYQQRPVPLIPASGTFVAAQYGSVGGVGTTVVQSDGSAGIWKVWSSDIQFLDPGDTIVGMNVFAKLIGASFNVTLLAKTNVGSSFIVGSVGTVNAGAGLTTSGVAQLFAITGLQWVVGDTATHFVQIDGLNGNAVGAGSEVCYFIEFIIAKQNG